MWKPLPLKRPIWRARIANPMNNFKNNFIMLLCLAIAGVAIIKVTWDNAPGGPFHPRQAWETWKNERAAQQPSAQRPSSPKKQLAPRRPQVTLSSTSGPVEINPLISLSGKTRKEIFELRKLFVQESIFHIPGYTPSAEVYGQIEDRKPWIAVTFCYLRDEPFPTQGPSEETRFINNPAILIGLESNLLVLDPEDAHLLNKSFCTSPAANYIPKKIYYDADDKEITVIYPKPSFFSKSSAEISNDPFSVPFALFVPKSQVSGLWQNLQRMGQPCVKTTNRIPGPSTEPNVSSLLILPRVMNQK